MWDPIEHRLALLELHDAGRLRRRRSQGEAWAWLAELPWTRRSGRRDELAVVEERREDVRALLDQVWPAWEEARARLGQAGLPPTERGWRELDDRARAGEIAPLPPRLNRRTALAQVGPHSKASLTATRREAIGDADVTRDGAVRLRPSAGLRVRRDELDLDATRLAWLLGELVLSERALRDGTRLSGARPAAVLLVENLGPYLDLDPPEGWLVAHVPGWNTRTVKLLLDQLADTPVVHFGDLDPNGVRIVHHLREHRADLLWAVPGFWREHVPDRALAARWPEELDLGDAPPLVGELAAAGLWLEQELITLDPRLRPALASLSARRA